MYCTVLLILGSWRRKGMVLVYYKKRLLVQTSFLLREKLK